MVKAHPLNAPHTAGLFCDMSLDGPVIGTLVIIVDRAKNLPNRKTIGKQDPYCAARLGKEAKKTTTDIRGGQTPRWDQEIRFTVHDSPDYYQLKISVFNDDKKTDLIGETWVDLRDIVVPGGGQNDLWHNLTCKGKYAGEIRIELTYYDTRPKPEKPAAKPKQCQVIFLLHQDSTRGHQEITLLQIMYRLLLTEHSQTHRRHIRRTIRPRTQDTTAVLRLFVIDRATPTLRRQTAHITPRQTTLMHGMHLQKGILCILKTEWSRPTTTGTPRIRDT
ncbi:hypothetical protein SLS63_009388 [Diaporthe eres]|uniref:C2 domain-containing protein n=1 Tax=Diaporthe eres TaxID=83184 RepID=A0ABR1NZX1_DIAER